MAGRDPLRPVFSRRSVSAAKGDRLAAAAAVLGHAFARPALLDEALTHPSARVAGCDYERFEFLGDRVLGLVIADMLLVAYPAEDEGALAKRLAALVRREALAQVAEGLGLGQHLLLSKGEQDTGGRANPALIADAVEAVIGALYLDGGLDAAEAFIRRHWTSMMEALTTPPQDPKTQLQEWAQAAAKPLPSYTTTTVVGPPHSPTFAVEARVEGHPPVTGKGRSKRAAEQAAATVLLARVAGAKSGPR